MKRNKNINMSNIRNRPLEKLIPSNPSPLKAYSQYFLRQWGRLNPELSYFYLGHHYLVAVIQDKSLIKCMKWKIKSDKEITTSLYLIYLYPKNLLLPFVQQKWRLQTEEELKMTNAHASTRLYPHICLKSSKANSI